MKTYRKILLCIIVMSLSIIASHANAARPKVIKTIPANGEQSVSPVLAKISIEFDQDMDTSAGMSICGGGPDFPETTGKPQWVNKRTLAMGVKLQANHSYNMSVNCQSYQNCKGINGESAEIYPLSFKTGSGSAKQNATASLQQSAVLLQKGIYAEETEGNLDKAMEIYSQIRKDYNDVERIAARAAYQMGTCYLKKGEKEKAASQFEEVINYFSEQKSVVEKAQQQLDKLGIKKDSDKNIFEVLGPASSFIEDKYGGVCLEAGSKKLYSNSQIYVVDKDFVLHKGGMGYIYNWTDKAISGKYKISNFSSQNQKFYDGTGTPMETEIKPNPNGKDYEIYWMPKVPLAPGGFFKYGWTSDGSETLSNNNATYTLNMQNHFGDQCYETFFLAVPEGMRIGGLSEGYTDKGNSNGWDIYWWKKEVPADTDHKVSVCLKKAVELVQEIHQDIDRNGLMQFWMPMHLKNKGNEPLTNYQFINSDFVSLTKITDCNYKSIEFTTTHENSIYRYNIKFNTPIKPGQDFVYYSYGTMKGLITPVPDLKDTYQYYMKHSPNSGVDTLRKETYLLPKGAEVISTIPPTMKRTEKEGRIELSVEEVIPPGGSITTSFQYKLNDAQVDIPQESLEKIVNKAVLTIATCTDGDLRVGDSLKTLKGIDETKVVAELAKYLDDSQPTVRRSALYALWRSGFGSIEQAEPKLLQLCSNEESYTRGMAALALGQYKAASSFETLKDMTLNDKDGYARRCAAYALGLYGDKAALPTLEKALNDSDALVKGNSQAAITMINKLNDSNEQIQK